MRTGREGADPEAPGGRGRIVADTGREVGMAGCSEEGSLPVGTPAPLLGSFGVVEVHIVFVLPEADWRQGSQCLDLERVLG